MDISKVVSVVNMLLFTGRGCDKLSVTWVYFQRGKAFGLSVIWSSKVSVMSVRNSMVKQSEPANLSVIMRTSVVEGCLLSRVPLYNT